MSNTPLRYKLKKGCVIFLNIGIAIVLLLVSLAAGVGVVFGVHYLAKMKSVFWSLIPSGGMLLISLLILLIMNLAGAKWLTSFITFYIFQIPVIAGVLALAPMRLHRRINVAAENEKAMRNQIARRIEAERRRQLEDSLLGFCCAESAMDPEGQRKIVLLSKTAEKSAAEIASLTGAGESEVQAILDAYERYASRLDASDNTADLILTGDQEEDIVCRLINSVPYECNAGNVGLWDKGAARELAANRVGSGVSTRIISAYLRHWGFTVPAAQTIKARSTDPVVRTWIVSEYEKIRKEALANNGEIVWIYTVPMEKVREISSFIPQHPVMMTAVTNDGAIRFKVYNDVRDRFSDFVTALVSASDRKIYAVVNEQFDEYMTAMGKAKLRALESKIQFFSCV